MNAVVDWISPTPTKQPGHYVIKIEIGDYTTVVLTYKTLYDRDEAQKIADEVNKKLKKDRDAIIEFVIKEEKKRAKMKRVLLIDDDKWLVKDLKYYIEDAGHDFTACSDTDEILQIYPEIDTYDVVILGLMMLKGETFLKSENEEEKKFDVGEILYNRIRKDFPKKDILIITSKFMKDIKIDIGNTTFMQKPIMTEEKLKAILKYIE